MKLTFKTDYCLRVLIYLQTHKEKAKIQEIADAYAISKNHLSVAVNKLSELGYVHTTPGPKGGLELNPAIKNKSVGSLVTKLEEFEIVECFNSEKSQCTLSPACKLKKMFQKARQSFVHELDQYKIKDLV